MFDKALLIAKTEAELGALALVVILATSSNREKRKDSWQAAEIGYLTALMSHEKKSADPKFDNIRALLMQDAAVVEPVLKEVWSSHDEAFRKSIVNSLSMRVIELCEYQDRFLGVR